MGIEPTSSAWKAEVLPLNYTRQNRVSALLTIAGVVEGGGFEPPKAEPSDLQSDPFDHSGTPPKREPGIVVKAKKIVKTSAKAGFRPPMWARAGPESHQNPGPDARIQRPLGKGRKTRPLAASRISLGAGIPPTVPQRT